MDLLDHPHRQDVAVGFAAELVGAMRRAHRDGERIDLGGTNEVDRLVGIGEQLVVADLALDAVTILLLTAAMLERTEHAELALHRRTDPMREIDDAAGDRHVVVVVGCGLGVRLQRAVHHH